MGALIDSVGDLGRRAQRPVPSGDHYGALVRAIVGQQLSTKAAYSINQRLLERFGGRAPTPQEVLAADPEVLRPAVGLSNAKMAFLRSLAEHVLSGQLELERMGSLDDEAVIAELTAVRGIGEWTAQMFLIFHLRRPDVMPTGDLGVRTAMMRAYRMRRPPAPERMLKVSRPWRPHRSTGALYLWRSLENEPAV